jgi:hypothetical protein
MFTGDSRIITAFVLMSKKRDFATFTAFCFCVLDRKIFESGPMAYRPLAIENRDFLRNLLKHERSCYSQNIEKCFTGWPITKMRRSLLSSPLLSIDHKVVVPLRDPSVRRARVDQCDVRFGTDFILNMRDKDILHADRFTDYAKVCSVPILIDTGWPNRLPPERRPAEG